MKTDEIAQRLAAHPSLRREGTLAIGRQVGVWKVVAFLAQGGGGEVYQARDRATGEHLALKFAPHVKADRLRHEAAFLSRYHHSSLPRIYGSVEIEEGFVLAEELLEPYPLPKRDGAVADFCYALCDVLGYCHKQGIVHRDLKPSNIMRRPSDYSLVVIDFGLAKRTTESGYAPPSDLSLTRCGNFIGVGTPGYAAPEQFSGIALSLATDIHALGVLLNNCFGTRLPYVWRPIIRKATSALPKLRYADTEKLCQAVRWRMLRPLLLLLFLSLLFGGSLYFLFRPTPEDPFAATRRAQRANAEYFRCLFEKNSDTYETGSMAP